MAYLVRGSLSATGCLALLDRRLDMGIDRRVGHPGGRRSRVHA